MAWPPTIPVATRTNATPQINTHPQDHNQISAALSEILNRINNPAAGRGAMVDIGLQGPLTNQIVQWTTPGPMTGGMTYSAGVFTVPTAGLYAVHYGLNIGGMNSNYIVAAWVKNSSVPADRYGLIEMPGAVTQQSNNGSCIVPVAAGGQLWVEWLISNTATIRGGFVTVGLT